MPLSARISLIRLSSTRSTVPIGAPSAPITFICARMSSKPLMRVLLPGLNRNAPEARGFSSWSAVRARLSVRVDRVLRFEPAEQLVDLDRLLGRDQRVGGRKSVLAGGLSKAAGGSG